LIIRFEERLAAVPIAVTVQFVGKASRKRAA